MDIGARRVVVGVHGSVGSLQALRRAVTEARSREAVLWSVIVWRPPGGEAGYRRVPSPPPLQRLWQDDAARRLRTAWEEALGGVPSDLAVQLFAVRGHIGDVLVRVASREDDLLVIGAGRRGGLRRVFPSSLARYCTARARCPVLAVPPPTLEHRFRHGQRRVVREFIGPAEP